MACATGTDIRAILSFELAAFVRSSAMPVCGGGTPKVPPNDDMVAVLRLVVQGMKNARLGK
jgi:hypothetical protein